MGVPVRHPTTHLRLGGQFMFLYSYIVARDYGFAPNPFFGCCTLATCKPVIRRCASVGDWVVGTGPKKKQRNGYLVFAMRIDDAMSYNKYWSDPRFAAKKPNMRSSVRNAYGDNIYRTDDAGGWIQQDSHHSMPHGKSCGVAPVWWTGKDLGFRWCNVKHDFRKDGGARAPNGLVSRGSVHFTRPHACARSRRGIRSRAPSVGAASCRSLR